MSEQPEMEITRGWVELARKWARANGDGQQVRLLDSWLERQDDCVVLSQPASTVGSRAVERLTGERDAEKARAEAAEARVAELEAERAWQPIETAPKDGTALELWDACTVGVVEATWGPCPGYSVSPFWRDDCGPLEDNGGLTHWRPKTSAPPQAASEGGEVSDA